MRKRSIIVMKGGAEIGRYSSIKECSDNIGIPSSVICAYARIGRIYKGGLEFKYGEESNK